MQVNGKLLDNYVLRYAIEIDIVLTRWNPEYCNMVICGVRDVLFIRGSNTTVLAFNTDNRSVVKKIKPDIDDYSIQCICCTNSHLFIVSGIEKTEYSCQGTFVDIYYIPLGLFHVHQFFVPNLLAIRANVSDTTICLYNQEDFCHYMTIHNLKL